MLRLTLKNKNWDSWSRGTPKLLSKVKARPIVSYRKSTFRILYRYAARALNFAVILILRKRFTFDTVNEVVEQTNLVNKVSMSQHNGLREVEFSFSDIAQFFTNARRVDFFQMADNIERELLSRRIKFINMRRDDVYSFLKRNRRGIVKTKSKAQIPQKFYTSFERPANSETWAIFPVGYIKEVFEHMLKYALFKVSTNSGVLMYRQVEGSPIGSPGGSVFAGTSALKTEILKTLDDHTYQ